MKWTFVFYIYTYEKAKDVRTIHVERDAPHIRGGLFRNITNNK